MADDAFEAARIKYVRGLQTVVDAMRECTELAEIYMNTLNDPDATLHINGTLKRKRGKGKDLDDEGGKRKRVKDPNAPKRPASSYILFQNDVRQTIKEKYPDLSPAELRGVISQEWANLKDDQKDHYKKAAESHKEKYMADKAAYAARSPEEVAAAARDVQEKPKRSKPTQKKASKTPAKVVSPQSSPEPEPAPVKQTSSAPDTEDSSEESGSSDEEEEEVEDDDDDEEVKPAPKKAKVSEKPASKRKARA
ncbi:hypothetical protein AAF712_008325 [Marasmius tenuissimus]|uniref:HMG box domain-containing protein n=1 Tax=Marasmius tenuissimus TaxID=585030 RepID=A0ABR2ZTR5_9AGAR|nr:hypothetical protein PM082_004880 [Marasmius tenuissimus]